MKINIISIDVTPNGKCFEIETKSDIGALYSTSFDVIKASSIENECYDLSDAKITSGALSLLFEMNSRHLV